MENSILPAFASRHNLSRLAVPALDLRATPCSPPRGSTTRSRATKEPFVPRRARQGRACTSAARPSTTTSTSATRAPSRCSTWSRAGCARAATTSRYVRNITDVDDKIIERAARTARAIEALAEAHDRGASTRTARAWACCGPTSEPRATRYVGAMLDMIATLEEKGLAYRGGQRRRVLLRARLSRLRQALAPQPGRPARGRARRGGRRQARPARLRPVEGGQARRARVAVGLGAQGRPGWHIECSAMSLRELGEPVRHPRRRVGPAVSRTTRTRSRRARARWHDPSSRTGCTRRSSTWTSEKMSKSLGNFVTTRDGARHRSMPCRAASSCASSCCAAHYRSEFSYSRDLARRRRQHAARLLHDAARGARRAEAVLDWASLHAARFRDAMNDDFDTPVAFAALHELRGEVNRTRSAELSGLMRALGGTIGLLQADPEASSRARRSTTSRRSSRSAMPRARRSDFSPRRPDSPGSRGRRDRARGQAGRADGVAPQMKRARSPGPFRRGARRG